MTDVPSAIPGLMLLPAGLATGLIILSRNHPALREAWSLLAAVVQTGLAFLMIPAILGGERLVWRVLDVTPEIPILLRVDALGIYFATLSSSLWIVTTVYSIGYTRALAEHAQTRYFASFALSLFAAVGIAFSGNLLTFFLFFELLSVATYPLVIHRGTADALRAGRIYLVYTLGAGALLLAGMAWMWSLAGRLDFEPGGILAGTGAGPATLWGLFILLIIGTGVKAAIMPLHTWLPIAMIAPTPVSALLHAVAVVKAGVFGVLRVVGFIFGPEILADIGAGTALAAACAATIVLGSLVALAQDNLKRLLAFSTVSQLSYIPLGAALGTADSFTGGVLHMASHALIKITLFFCAGALYATAHVERVSEMRGIGWRMPYTMGAFTVAAFLLAGLPPGAAFLSKWHLVSGAAVAGVWWAVAALLASALLNIAYFTPIVIRAFSAPEPGRRQDWHGAHGDAAPEETEAGHEADHALAVHAAHAGHGSVHTGQHHPHSAHHGHGAGEAGGARQRHEGDVGHTRHAAGHAHGEAAAHDGHDEGEARLAMLVPLLLTATAALVVGLVPDMPAKILSLARAVTAGVLGVGP